MQPHVFCGPEFLLAIPQEQLESVLQTSESKTDDLNYGSRVSNKSSNRSNRVQEDILLQWQADIYSICTPRTRRALHYKISSSTTASSNKSMEDNKMTKRDANPFINAGTSIASGLKLIAELNTGPIPSSPPQLQFVQIRYDGEMSSEERASFQHSIKLAEQQQHQQQSKEVHKSKEKQEEEKESKVESMNEDHGNYIRHQSLPLSESTTSTASVANNKFVYLLLYLTDSRVAAEVYMLLLRNVYLSLSSQCRMYNFFRLTSRAAPVVLSELLHKREILRSHYNLDADLWSAVHEAMTPELRNEILSEGVSSQSSSTNHNNVLSSSNTTNFTVNMSGRPLTAAEEHHNAIKRVLHYCENNVQYAAVLDENEEASPFLCAFYFANELQMTCDDLLQFFIRHPRRVIRVLALFLARYLLPPEELPVVFYGALFDDVVIACSADLQLTLSVKEIAHALLRQDEFNEAWLPALHKYWMESIIVRDIDDMTALYNEHQRQKRALDSNEATITATTKVSNNNNKAIQEVKGSGKGIAGTLGFHSIKDLARHAEMHQEQMFVPQRMVTLVTRRRGIYDDDEYIHSGTNSKFINISVENDMNNDAQLEEEEETRDFFDEYLIDIEVTKSESTSSGTVLPGLQSARHNFTNPDGSHKRSRDSSSSLPHLQQDHQIQKRQQSSQGQLANNTLRNKNDMDNKVTTNEQVNVFRQGERLILSLLGRTTPIRPNDPVYLEFERTRKRTY